MNRAEKISDNYIVFAAHSLALGLLYAICMFKNVYGITIPVFTAGVMIIAYSELKQLGVEIKKDAAFYAAAVELIAINVCTTTDSTILFYEYVGMILLTMSGLLHIMYDDRRWDMGQYFAGIIEGTFGAIQYSFTPVTHLREFLEKRSMENADEPKKPSTVIYILFGFAIGIPLLIVVLVLLGSADLVFGEMLKAVFKNMTLTEAFWNVILFIIMLVFGFFASYVICYKLATGTINEKINEIKNYNPIIAITINSMLAVVYLVFSIIQIVYLFAKNLTLPSGYTYAEYARQGFFQLLAVCIINMILVLACLRHFVIEEMRKSNVVLKILLTVITLCTYIMIASSMLRMIMYIQIYQLTMLRLLTIWMLVVLTFVMTGIIIMIYKKDFPLFKLSMIVVTVMFIALIYSYPTKIIAKYNLSDKFIATEDSRKQIDYDYINFLSCDATPIIVDAIKKVDDDKFAKRFYFAHRTYEMEQNDIREDDKVTYGGYQMKLRKFNFAEYECEQALLKLNEK